MKIATWNVNSVKARRERVLTWLDHHQPDVLCLQELKVTEDSFPHEDIHAAGYRAAVYGQKTYNGVAILSREEPQQIRTTLEDGEQDPQARLISACVFGVRIINVYVPNGAVVGSDKWAYKLRWYQRLLSYLGRTASPQDPVLLCGDFNVAPDDKDVRRVDDWKNTVLCHPEGREALQRVTQWGLEDVFRMHNPDGGVYSWWDYRMLGFPKNNGLRIDLVLATQSLAAKCTSAYVDRDERKGKQPSDHAPVVVELTL